MAEEILPFHEWKARQIAKDSEDPKAKGRVLRSRDWYPRAYSGYVQKIRKQNEARDSYNG